MTAHKLITGGKSCHIEQTDKGFTLNRTSLQSDVAKLADGSWHVLLGTKGYRVSIAADESGKDFLVTVNGCSMTIHREGRLDALLHRMGLDAVAEAKVQDLKAPMPGLVVKILVEEGTVVEKGTPLLILEAMKMENILRSPGQATVSTIAAQQGKAVEKGEVLVRFS